MREFYLVLQDIGSVLGGNLARKTEIGNRYSTLSKGLWEVVIFWGLYTLVGQSERRNKKDWRWVTGFSRQYLVLNLSFRPL